MQQATVNLFADMNVQPVTLQAGLVAASASTDAIAPSSTITSPAAGATVPQGSPTTITGTAADTGGGVVGGVEVSVDNGATWRPANGRGNWTYSWTPTVAGSATIRSRAVDDSGNLEAPGPGVTVTVGAGTLSCSFSSIWAPSATPTIPSDPDTAAVNLGVKFTADQNGFITGIRFYKGPLNAGTHVGTLWSSAGAQLASVTFSNETASGWQQANFASPVAITANTVYVASYHAPVGRYANDNGYFLTTGVDNPPLRALRDGVSGSNGVYAYGAGTTFPTSSFQATNYWVDVCFTTSLGPDTTPPTLVANTPANGATNVVATTTVTATFSEAMDAATINSSTVELRDPVNALVAATVTYNATTLVATLTPSGPLAASTTYTATIRGGGTDPRVKDVAGNALAANATWSFTTAAADVTPPTVTTTTPANGAVNVSRTTTVTATFSEAMDPATINGTTFELRDSANVLVAATVTYNATTRVATLTPGSQLAGSTVYTATVLGGAADPRVKDLAGNALAANRTWSFTTVAADVTPPTVTTTSPADGATGFVRTANITATFSEAMTAATINTTTFELRDPANALVPAAVTYNATTRVATLNPSPTLAWGTMYTATVRGGATDPRVKDLAGNALAADKVWSFTTVVDTTLPTVTTTSPAGGAVNVSRTANVTATFSEAMTAATINTTTFELRDPTNALVTATVSYNTTSFVATLNPTPTLAWNTVYTATVKGGSTDPRVKDAQGNALAADRVWSFTTVADTTPPTVTSISPANGATNVSRTANVTGTFSEAMDPATINTTTFELRDAVNVLVPAVVTYNATTRVATLNPTPTLAGVANYTATIRGGATDPRVKDAQGNPLAANRVWTFTTGP
jgi:hypothetical protein